MIFFSLQYDFQQVFVKTIFTYVTINMMELCNIKRSSCNDEHTRTMTEQTTDKTRSGTLINVCYERVHESITCTIFTTPRRWSERYIVKKKATNCTTKTDEV